MCEGVRMCVRVEDVCVKVEGVCVYEGKEVNNCEPIREQNSKFAI